MGAITTWAANRLNMRFASEAARDAALPNPTEGMEAFTGTGPSATKWVYYNGAWERYVLTSGGIGFGSLLLDEISLPTNDRYATLTVPVSLRGTLRKYVVEVEAGAATVLSNETRPLCIRPNADTGANYRTNSILFEGGTIIGGANQSDTSAPWTAYLGRFAGSLEVTFTPRAIGPTGYMAWRGYGYVNSGGTTDRTFTTGGRWNSPTNEVISTFELLTNVGSAFFANSPRARLWGYR
ncbi:hypothetical protein LQF12_02120 [Ruania suaedae]|uniref:hypothetical protein n=1 Tax=Ruania suaedae TaxID=2897774 RepID=UPI001E538A5B|nr:hypothetical protein [Ruania suaedae]UFU03428.1 hypothetical protein LQF12_02120 [Ruania suaedae]